uniref:Uncharacterized protein n=1 Tax=Steinernema glaseri TaxID=37863 RepID=A0A1I8A3X0_9BILA
MLIRDLSDVPLHNHFGCKPIIDRSAPVTEIVAINLHTAADSQAAVRLQRDSHNGFVLTPPPLIFPKCTRGVGHDGHNLEELPMMDNVSSRLFVDQNWDHAWQDVRLSEL